MGASTIIEEGTGMRAASGWLRAAIAATLTIGMAVAGNVSAGAQPTSGLDFYTDVPADLTPYAPGDVIAWETETDLGPKFVDLTAYRVMFRSDGYAGQPTAEVAMVYIPDGAAPTGGWPLVVWDHGTTGVGDSCAPSKYPSLDPRLASAYGVEVARLVRQGYVVAAPDYEGLGTPGLHSYMQTDAEAYATIDAARAARRMGEQVGVDVSTRWAVIGHSQGGHAAVGAAELAPERAPEFQMVGAVALAPFVMLRRLMEAIARQPYVFPLVGYIGVGIMATHPGFDYANFVGPQLLPYMSYAEEWCWNSGGWFDQMSTLLRPGVSRNLAPDWGKDPDVQDYLRDSQIGTRPTDVPIHYLQGTADGLYAVAPDLVDRLCALGDAVHFSTYPGVGHDQLVWNGWPESRDWLANRFAGLTAPTTAEAPGGGGAHRPLGSLRSRDHPRSSCLPP
jgi:pimeloyl-ACP methyl ester carboxylesterase